ncbi:MAG: LacI family DNA-binding transcriptional regulator [Oscillospiraceae bacterium]|nr:LacI family DNA-binding transcriptional regulator [Oscillospiraceae bacterium]
MSITIKDVAREANVCIATVSRAFNSPDKVSEEKRKHIYEVAKRLNYSPNALAKSLVTRSSQTIGVLVPDIDNLFYPCVVKGIDNACQSRNYLSSVANTYDSVEQEQYYINLLRNQRVDGFIFVGTRSVRPEDSRHIAELAKRTPVVMLYSDLSEMGVCSIVTDDVSGAKKAVKHLYDRGHRRIAFFSSHMPHLTYAEKQRGYEEALMELELPLRRDYIFRDKPYISGGYACMQQMCRRFAPEECPTAIFAVSDQVAMGVWRYCSLHGLRIPDDVEMVGYSGTSMAREMFPELTTVDQLPDKLGQLAVNTILSMKNNDLPNMKRIVFEPELLCAK